MTAPLNFFKIDDSTLYHDGFSYLFYRILDPPKSSADLQLNQLFHCALSKEEENSRIHVTGNWEMDNKGSKFMLGIIKKGDHTHEPEYRDTTQKLRFYKNNDKSLHRNGFDYSLYRELDPPKQIADFQWYQTYSCSMSDRVNCRARIYTTGQWEVNKREFQYQLGIFKNCIHSHESNQISFQGKDNDDETPEAGLKFYRYMDEKVHRDGHVYCLKKFLNVVHHGNSEWYAHGTAKICLATVSYGQPESGKLTFFTDIFNVVF